MKFIRNFLDRIEPDKKSSPFLHTLWDGFDTFLYAPASVTKNGVHIRDGMDLKRTMIHVVLAMQLAFIAGVVNIGHQHYTAFGMYAGAFQGIGWKFAYGLLQMLPLIIVVHIVGLGIEFFFAAKKGHSIEEGFLVSAFLIPMIMPPDVPLWMVAIATAFAVIVAKEAFGGTGMNILNIALTARVFVFFAYPSEISGEICWISYDYNALHSLFGIKAHTVDYLANLPNGGVAFDSMFDEAGQFIANSSVLIDGWSGATPLGLAANGGWSAVQEASYTIIDPLTNKAEVIQQYSTTNLLMGVMPGSIGEMNKVAVILGALILAVSGIGSWRIMVSMVLGAVAVAVLMNLLGESLYPDQDHFIKVPWYYQLFMGSFLFAMAFMATDPVTASGTDLGKLFYGFGIGAVGMVVRVLNPAYPEGWMLAILFMNVFAPLIDYFVLQSNIKRREARVQVQ